MIAERVIATNSAVEMRHRAAALGFTLVHGGHGGEAYWLSWQHLVQCCPTLEDVDVALEPGSAFRQLVARVSNG